MSKFNGNEVDGFEALMTEVESGTIDKVEVSEPIVQENIQQVDEPIVKSEAQVEVAPRTVEEPSQIRQESIPQPTEPTVDYEHKFKVIEGMLKARNAEVEAILTQKEAEVEAERQARVDAEQKLAEIPLDYAEIMGEDAYDDLGEEAINGLDKMMEAKFNAKMSSKDSEIDNLKSIINNLQDGFSQKSKDEEEMKIKSDANEHDRRVMQEVPEFFSYLKDGKFIAFLDTEKDRLTGLPLRKVFDDADMAFDSVIVSNICKLYKNSLEVSKEAAYKKEEHVAPSVNSQTPVSLDKPIMKWADYNKMTDRLLNQTVTDEEFTRFNQAFELAKKEGRVQ